MIKRNSISHETKEGQVGVRYITLDLLKKLVGSTQFENVISLNLTLIDDAGQIKYIENLDRFRHLKKLTLSKNCIEKIDNISHLTNLKELYISSNCLTKIEGLELLINLQVLDISYNKIKHVPKWLPQNLSQLRVLKIEYNRLEDMTEFLWFRSLVNFVSLNISGNLFTEIPQHKLYLLFHLRCLQRLDDEDVTFDQRERAKHMYDQVEVDRLSNLITEKETECFKLADALKEKSENVENEQKSRQVLEEKNKKFEKLTKENNEKLEITHDILKKKTKSLMDVNLKHIELEHNLAFYKIDHKFDSLVEKSFCQTLTKSPEQSTDTSSTFGDSPYIGKALFKQSLIPLEKVLPNKSLKTVKCDTPNVHFLDGDQRYNSTERFNKDVSVDANDGENYIQIGDHWNHDVNSTHEIVSQSCEVGDIVPSQVPASFVDHDEDAVPSNYFEEDVIEVKQGNSSDFGSECDEQHRTISIGFGFDEETLSQMEVLISELRNLFRLKTPNKTTISDKAGRLKLLCKRILSKDLRDSECSPIPMIEEVQPNHKLEKDNTCLRLAQDLKAAFKDIGDLRTQVAKCELNFKDKLVNQTLIEELCKDNKLPLKTLNKDEKKFTNKKLQEIFTNKSVEGADSEGNIRDKEEAICKGCRHKNELTPKKEFNVMSVQLPSEEKNNGMKEFCEGVCQTSTPRNQDEEKHHPSYKSVQYPTIAPNDKHLFKNDGWFCNIPCHIHWDEGLNNLKEKLENIIGNLYNKKSVKSSHTRSCCSKKDCWIFERLLKKLKFRGRSLDVLDLAIEDQRISMKHLEMIERCLWQKRSYMNDGIQKIKKNVLSLARNDTEESSKLCELAQINLELKVKSQELSMLDNQCQERLSKLKNIRNQTYESIKEFEKQHLDAVSEMDMNARLFANLKNEIWHLEFEKETLQNKVTFLEANNITRLLIPKSAGDVDIPHLNVDCETRYKQEKLCETLDLISKHEAEDEKIVKNTEKKLLALQKIERKCKSMENEVHSLVDSVEMHQTFLKEIQQDFHSVEKLVKSLKADSKTIDKELIVKIKHRDGIDNEISTKSEKISLLNDMIKTKKQSIQELESHLNTLQDKSSVLTTEIEKKSDEIMEATRDLSKNILFLKESEIRIQQGQNELMSLTHKKNVLNSESRKLLNDKQDLIIKIKESEADLNSLTQKRSDVELNIKNREKDLESLMSKLSKVRDDFIALESQRDGLTACLNQLKKETSENQLQLSIVRGSVKTYTLKQQLLLQKINDLQSEKHQGLNELEEIKQNIIKSKKVLEIVTSEYQLCQDVLNKKKAEIEKNENDLGKLLQQLDEQKGIFEKTEKYNQEESLLAELLEEKMLLNENADLYKREKEQLLLRIEQSKTELLHLKIDFCDKTKKLITSKVELEKKLDAASRLVTFLMDKLHGLVTELSHHRHSKDITQLGTCQDADEILTSARDLLELTKQSQKTTKNLTSQGMKE